MSTVGLLKAVGLANMPAKQETYRPVAAFYCRPWQHGQLCSMDQVVAHSVLYDIDPAALMEILWAVGELEWPP